MRKIIVLIMAAVISTILLAGCSKDANSGFGNGKFNVRVHVCDASGKPVSGVKVQACDDVVCTVCDTDETGLAGFSMDENVAEIHIIRVPEGFKADSNVYSTEKNGELTVTLEAD